MRLALAAAIAALLPAAALAQPYYEQPTPYPDDYQQQQQSRSADDYARDSSDYQADPDAYAKDGRYGRERFTGRVGSSWRDADGQYCSWREVVRQDGDGYDAYKWVTVCRD